MAVQFSETKPYFAKTLALKNLLGERAFSDFKRLMDPCCGTGVDKVIACSEECDSSICLTVKNCLGVFPGGNSSLILNQVGEWIPTGALQRVVEVTSDQLLNMLASPIELVPTPGMGNFIVVDKLIAVYYFNTLAYLNPGNTNAVIAANNIIQLGKFFTSAADKVVQIGPTSVTLTENQPLLLTHTVSEMTTGDGAARIYIYYTINAL